MRPTELNFRSPKQRTPPPYYPLKTYLGGSLIDSPKGTRGTFCRSKRFIQYDIDREITGTEVGPGTYKQDLPKKIGVHLYKLGYKDKNCYAYFRNHLVYDPDSTFNIRLKTSLRKSRLGTNSESSTKTKRFYSVRNFQIRPLKTNPIKKKKFLLDNGINKYLNRSKEKAEALFDRMNKTMFNRF